MAFCRPVFFRFDFFTIKHRKCALMWERGGQVTFKLSATRYGNHVRLTSNNWSAVKSQNQQSASAQEDLIMKRNRWRPGTFVGIFLGGGLLALGLSVTTAFAQANADPVAKTIGGGQLIDMASVPQMTNAPAAALQPLAPRTGTSEAEYVARKAAAAKGSGGAASASVEPGAPSGGDGRETPATARAFFGIGESNCGGCRPSDMGLAANGAFVVQAVNSSIAVWSSLGVLQSGFPKSLSAF